MKQVFFSAAKGFQDDQEHINNYLDIVSELFYPVRLLISKRKYD